MKPQVQYATTRDGVSIAYATYGSGGTPLVLMKVPFFSHIELEWTRTTQTESHEIERLAERRMVVHIDPRGSGLSQRGISDYSIDARVLDLEAVVDRLRLDRFAISAAIQSGLVALAFAARFPAPVSHLVLGGAYANGAGLWATPRRRGMAALAELDWETFTETFGAIGANWTRPERAREMASWMRASITQQDFLGLVHAEQQTDLRPLLPLITAPALVTVSPGGDFMLKSEFERQLVAGLPDARMISVEGADDTIRVVNEFLADKPSAPAPPPLSPDAASAFRTILFTDIEGHTEMMTRLGDDLGREVLRQHERITREALKQHGGSEVKTMGDGFMASFGSATRAVECAAELQRAFAAHAQSGGEPLRIRVGINAGEPVADQNDLFGTAVIVAARLVAQAAGSQVVVSDVVRQLVAGKQFLFSDRGETVLKGFDEPMRTWELLW